jgi:KIX domain
MEGATVEPQERKAILKRMFHALRRSPMFSHYTIEHIRGSAIKAEQMTFDRSRNREEYVAAMNAKLLKIEKSYVMNVEEMKKEMGDAGDRVGDKPSSDTEIRPLGGKVLKKRELIPVSMEVKEVPATEGMAEYPQISLNIKNSSDEREEGERLRKAIEGSKEEIERMSEIVESHVDRFPEKKGAHSKFRGFKELIYKESSSSGRPSISVDSLNAMMQQMKKHVIEVSAEMKREERISVGKRIERIRRAFISRSKREKTYLFTMS